MIWNAYKCSKDKDKEIQKTTYSWRRSIVVITLVSAVHFPYPAPDC